MSVCTCTSFSFGYTQTHTIYQKSPVFAEVEKGVLFYSKLLQNTNTSQHRLFTLQDLCLHKNQNESSLMHAKLVGCGNRDNGELFSGRVLNNTHRCDMTTLTWGWCVLNMGLTFQFHTSETWVWLIWIQYARAVIHHRCKLQVMWQVNGWKITFPEAPLHSAMHCVQESGSNSFLCFHQNWLYLAASSTDLTLNIPHNRCGGGWTWPLLPWCPEGYKTLVSCMLPSWLQPERSDFHLSLLCWTGVMIRGLIS